MPRPQEPRWHLEGRAAVDPSRRETFSFLAGTKAADRHKIRSGSSQVGWRPGNHWLQTHAGMRGKSIFAVNQWLDGRPKHRRDRILGRQGHRNGSGYLPGASQFDRLLRSGFSHSDVKAIGPLMVLRPQRIVKLRVVERSVIKVRAGGGQTLEVED